MLKTLSYKQSRKYIASMQTLQSYMVQLMQWARPVKWTGPIVRCIHLHMWYLQCEKLCQCYSSLWWVDLWYWVTLADNYCTHLNHHVQPETCGTKNVNLFVYKWKKECNTRGIHFIMWEIKKPWIWLYKASKCHTKCHN
jgi:hypothetical protein